MEFLLILWKRGRKLVQILLVYKIMSPIFSHLYFLTALICVSVPLHYCLLTPAHLPSSLFGPFFLELLYNYIQSPQSRWKFSHFYKHVMKSNLSYISRYQPQEKKKEKKKRGSVVKKCKRCFTEIVQSFMILITSELLSFINSSTSYRK